MKDNLSGATNDPSQIDLLKLQNAEKRYEEICDNIRALDENSFRLLGFVPLVSTAAILGLEFLKIPLPVFWLIAWIGAAVTFGLYRWEMRNVQICKWLQERADWIERNEFHVTGRTQFQVRLLKKGQTAPFDDPDLAHWHEFLRLPFTQRKAESIIYGATILAWLGLPLAAWLSQRLYPSANIP